MSLIIALVLVTVLGVSLPVIWYILLIERTREKKRLCGLVCLVTGGASGIGEALTEILVSKGAIVEVWDVSDANIDRAREKYDGVTFRLTSSTSTMCRVTYKKVDVGKVKEVEKAAGSLIAKHGGIDVLINNAGIANPFDLEESSISELEQVVNTNFTSHMWTIRAFLPHLRKSKRVNGMSGSVVAVSSVLGQVGTGGLQGYCSTKAAVIGLMESLYMQHKDIHWLTVCPYLVDTALFTGMRHRFQDYFYQTLDSRQLAVRIVRGIEDQRSFITVPFLWNWMFIVIKSLVPLPVMRWIQDLFDVRLGYLNHAQRLERYSGHR